MCIRDRRERECVCCEVPMWNYIYFVHVRQAFYLPLQKIIVLKHIHMKIHITLIVICKSKCCNWISDYKVTSEDSVQREADGTSCNTEQQVR